MCPSAVLRHDEIGTAVVIEVEHRSATLFSVNLDSGLFTAKWSESAIALATQEEPSSRIHPGNAGARSEKVLRQKKIFAPVQIEISDGESEHRSHLCFTRQFAHFEKSFAIEQNNCFQSRC